MGKLDTLGRALSGLPGRPGYVTDRSSQAGRETFFDWIIRIHGYNRYRRGSGSRSWGSDACRGKNVYMERHKFRGELRKLALVIFVEAHDVLHSLAVDPSEFVHSMDKRVDVGHRCLRSPTHRP